MKCPFCQAQDTKVIDSRPADDNSSIRRRRQCESCNKRFTTYEKLETIPTIPSGSPKHMQHNTQLSIPTIRHATEYCSSFIYPPLNHFIQTYRPVRSDFHLIT